MTRRIGTWWTQSRNGAAGDRRITSEVELFRGLTAHELSSLGRHLTVTPVPEGAHLGRAGAPCRFFAVVLEGQVGVAINGTPIAMLPAGTFLGELPLLSPMGARVFHTDTVALTDAVVAVANPREFMSIMYDFPVVADRIRAVADRRRRYVAEMEIDVTTWIPEDHDNYPMHPG